MSRFEKLSHVIWHCQYHIVWVPKYRYKVLQGRIKEQDGLFTFFRITHYSLSLPTLSYYWNPILLGGQLA